MLLSFKKKIGSSFQNFIFFFIFLASLVLSFTIFLSLSGNLSNLEQVQEISTLQNDHKIEGTNVKSYRSLNVFLQEFLDKLFDTLDNETEIQLFEKFISEIEKQLITKTLKYYSGNQIRSSKLLGINRNTLRSKIQKYKITNKFNK